MERELPVTEQQMIDLMTAFQDRSNAEAIMVQGAEMRGAANAWIVEIKRGLGVERIRLDPKTRKVYEFTDEFYKNPDSAQSLTE